MDKMMASPHVISAYGFCSQLVGRYWKYAPTSAGRDYILSTSNRKYERFQLALSVM
jgi:hypothetical protein